TSPNGALLTPTMIGNVTGVSSLFGGGVAAVAAVAQVATITLGGTFEVLDFYTITVNGVSVYGTGRGSGAGTSIYVKNNRIYSCANTHLAYCGINEPTNWTDTSASSGAGFINISSQTNGAERLQGVEDYGVYSAIFSSRSVVLYSLYAD